MWMWGTPILAQVIPWTRVDKSEDGVTFERVVPGGPLPVFHTVSVW